MVADLRQRNISCWHKASLRRSWHLRSPSVCRGCFETMEGEMACLEGGNGLSHALKLSFKLRKGGHITATAFRQISATSRLEIQMCKWKMACWQRIIPVLLLFRYIKVSFWIFELSVLALSSVFTPPWSTGVPLQKSHMMLVCLPLNRWPLLTIVAQSLSIGSFTVSLACICAYNTIS